MLTIDPLLVTDFAQNCRILSLSDTGEGVVIDPGGDIPKILDLLKRKNIRCTGIWLTHAHLDHAGGVAALKRELKVPLWAHRAEAAMRARLSESAALFGLPPTLYENCPEPEHFIAGGDILKLGSFEFEVRFTPGHSPGHVVFYCGAAQLVIAGDTIFRGSIGRTDLPGGDHKVLMASIKNQLLTLPPDTNVLPGHGDDTVIGVELDTNPFLR
jgi:hydroxyacylglutathione hydrolase